MPTPCTNCILFHYGQCRYPPRQCRICCGWGHIERYCPSNPTGHNIRREHGELLAGTKAWCEHYGLDADPDLKFQVLQALKTNPGSAIHINGVCIYGGSSKSYVIDGLNSIDPPRGRTLEERMGRRRDPRSASPGRDRRCPSRSLSPRGGRRGRPLTPKAPRRESRYRSRSPRRQRPRTPSPYRQPNFRARSPRYAEDTNAVVFEARDRENHRSENQRPREAGRLTPVRFEMPRPHHALPPRPSPFFDASRAPLGQVSTNVSRGDQFSMSDAAKEQPQATQSHDIMDDPYFVLGVSKGATEAEILTAFQTQMHEIDLERKNEGGGSIMPNSIWNDSIDILRIAKRQLLGK